MAGNPLVRAAGDGVTEGGRHSSVVEHVIGNDGVGGSIPPGGTTNYTWLDQARFWSKVSIPEGPHHNRECWPWANSTAKGYGQIKVRGAVLRAHRVAYEIVNGTVPTGLHILHTCDNTLCVNPAHLRAGTHQDNMDEKRERGRVWYGGPVGRDDAA
jgi:hypothetical protein